MSLSHFSRRRGGASLTAVEMGVSATWGPYRLAELLHAGRITRTYRALGEGGRPISLKVLQPFANVREHREGLLREAHIQGLCEHPGIVAVLAAGESEASFYIARQYVVGASLSEVYRALAVTGGHVPQPIVAALGVALLEALECVHQRRDEEGRLLGLVHRDVTPANILLGEDGAVFLTDFGLAHAPARQGPLADDEIMQGTLRYLPPEVTEGKPPDERADLFQLALSLAEGYGVSLGPLPFGSAALVQKGPFSGQLRSALERLGGSGLVLAKALARRSSGRYDTAAEMLTDWKLASGGSVAGREEIAAWLHSTMPPGGLR